MVDKNNIEDQVKQLISEQLGIEKSKVQDDASFVEDLGADSLDTVELVMALEEKFDAEITDEEAESIATVRDAVEYITKRHPS